MKAILFENGLEVKRAPYPKKGGGVIPSLDPTLE